jgi:NAD(P)-dependent dehydrogenase (short-subunit alcohol dehydrogenase family)
MKRDTKRVTVVTGGSRGIGAATVLALARAGHGVAFSYRSDADSADRIRTAASNTGTQCVAIRADVTQDADIDRLFDEAAELGMLTGLVNNAGVTAHARASRNTR